MSSIDEEIKAIEQEGFLKRAFKIKGKFIPNMLISSGLSLTARYFYTKYAKDSGMGEEMLAFMSTVVDIGVFWPAYIPQVAFRERDKMKEKGKYVKEKILKKMTDYTGLIGSAEVVYFGLSVAAQYLMQKAGVEPENAGLAIQGTAIALFTGIMPILQYSSEVGSEQLFNAFKKQPKPYE